MVDVEMGVGVVVAGFAQRHEPGVVAAGVLLGDELLHADFPEEIAAARHEPVLHVGGELDENGVFAAVDLRGVIAGPGREGWVPVALSLQPFAPGPLERRVVASSEPNAPDVILVHHRDERHAGLVLVGAPRVGIHMVHEQPDEAREVLERRFVKRHQRLVDLHRYRAVAIDADGAPFDRTRHEEVGRDVNTLLDRLGHQVIELVESRPVELHRVGVFLDKVLFVNWVAD